MVEKCKSYAKKIPSLSVIQFFDELASPEAVIFLTGQIFSKAKIRTRI